MSQSGELDFKPNSLTSRCLQQVASDLEIKDGYQEIVVEFMMSLDRKQNVRDW